MYRCGSLRRFSRLPTCEKAVTHAFGIGMGSSMNVLLDTPIGQIALIAVDRVTPKSGDSLLASTARGGSRAIADYAYWDFVIW
jgi:hypothetical protein